jgi:predicted MFS family arabinose efflux permease
MFKVGALLGGPVGGYLSSHFAFIVPAALTAAMHLTLVPLFGATLREKVETKKARQAWSDAGQQFRTLVRSRTLLSAAFMVFLIALEPGFGTPLLYHQTDVLNFSRQYVGNLVLVTAGSGLVGASFYYWACRRFPLGTMLVASVFIHALGTLTYFFYRSPETAFVVSAITGITGTLALLPTYDLAARATPKGSEALGYSVMMSVWNFTNAFFDWVGSWVFTAFQRDFGLLILINAGSTFLVLLGIPLLPKEMRARRDDGSAPPAALDD